MIQEILNEWSIPYEVQQSGWLNIRCPFCGDTGLHLGCAPDSAAFHCWRCGNHPTVETLTKVLGVSENETWDIIRKHNLFGKTQSRKIIEKVRVQINPFKFPRGTGPLRKTHSRYLEERNFDPKRIIREWDIQGTGPMALLDGINYQFRIVIPISWKGEIVSFQARDITGNSDLRYIACPMEREIITHKHIIYGNQEHWSKSRTGIICEGVTDVWRLGYDACCTFGMEFTMEQVMAIGKNFDRIFILFDNERLAQRQARKLAIKLRMLGKEVYLETIEGSDPGGMEQKEADYLVSQLMGKGY